MSWELYYWAVPFRSVPIRLLFAQANVQLFLPESSEVAALKNLSVAQQPVPAMAPPFLMEQETGVALSQMPAIVLYVSQRLGLVKQDPLALAHLVKVVADMNDILCEVTRNNGQTMWQQEEWQSFLKQRLPRWAEISVQNAQNYGALLDTKEPNAVDLIQWAIWGSLERAFPQLQPWFEDQAPQITELLKQRAKAPRVVQFFKDEADLYGQDYCGGLIEESLRSMMPSHS